jgi:hypothetical protein
LEIKSGATVASDFFAGLDYWRDQLAHATLHPWLIYGGDTRQTRDHGTVLPWSDLNPLLDGLVG